MDLAEAPTALHGDRPEGPTPTIGSYFLAGAVAVVVGSVLIDVILLLQTEGLSTLPYFLLALLFIVLVGTGAAITFGLPLVAIAHHHLRYVQQFWIHLLVFAAVGAAVGGLTIALLFFRAWPIEINALIVAATALAAVVGRLAIAGRARRFTIPSE